MLHIPVLLEEVIHFLRPKESHVYIDATLGLGGHTKAMLSENPSLQVIAFDQDPFAMEKAKEILSPWKNQITFFLENFEHLPKRIEEEKIQPDAILLDIGVSSLHLDDETRGFSFRNDGPLDMRMDPKNPLTAEILIAKKSEEDLAKIFADFGEETHSRLIAKKIVEDRKKTPFTSTKQLAEFIERITSPFTQRVGGGHPAAQAFQALRIAVNRELEVLESTLQKAVHLLAPGGRLAVISFHSLEDKIVKILFQSLSLREKKQKYPSLQSKTSNPQENFKILTKKPILPSPQEQEHNPRARSARLRVIEKEAPPQHCS